MVDLNLTPRLEALSRLAEIAGANFTLRGDEIIRWTKGDKPTEEEIQSKMDSVAYARNRKIEYLSLNQFELISDDSINSTTTHKDAIVAIKTKWPKDNSGPV